MEVVRYHFPKIDSTNTWAKKNIPLLDPTKITLVTADAQTKGRGTKQRTWFSPPSLNLYESFCFFLDSNHQQRIRSLPQILALTTADTLTSLGFSPQLKWPNDLLLNSKKVAGILCETTPVGDHRLVILGIGLNINMPSDLLEEIKRPATSLLAESGKMYDVKKVQYRLEKTFIPSMQIFLKEGFAPFLSRYQQYLMFSPHQKLLLSRAKQPIEGLFHAINPDGSLSLLLPNGQMKTVYSGEINL